MRGLLGDAQDKPTLRSVTPCSSPTGRVDREDLHRRLSWCRATLGQMPATFDQLKEAVRAGKIPELVESDTPWRDASGMDRCDIHCVATWLDENGVKQRYELSGTEKDEIVNRFDVSVRRLDADLIPMGTDDDEP